MLFRKIVVERKGCSGESPIYQVAAFSAGQVFWHGEKFVSKLGKHQWKLSADTVQKLANVINDFDFHHMEHCSITRTVSDRPCCNILVELTDGSIKQMNHYLGDELEDERLIKLENKLDRLIGTNKWKNKTH